jgi:hypothetical protein
VIRIRPAVLENGFGYGRTHAQSQIFQHGTDGLILDEWKGTKRNAELAIPFLYVNS